MNISVIGTGYVGLVTGACLAGSGNNVICVDIDEEKINSLKEGRVTFYEPGLEDIVKKNLKEERLLFTTDLDYAIKNSSVVLIAVGTPSNGDGSADTSAVINVANSIGKSLDDYKVIVTKSTVPVGTTEMIRDEIKKVTDIKFDVASNPEFLKEGSAVEDFMKPDRVLIGVDNESTSQILKELYAPFMRSMDRALVVSIRSSELAKYTANAMLATRISFMNEIANLSELLGANISEVRVAIGSDDRIGRHFLFPGIGYGGSCFPKDVKALINTASEFGYELKVCKAADEVNTKQRELFWLKIENYFEGHLQEKRFSVWGISFKPKTDDIREAPSIYIIDKLLSAGALVTVHDPVAMGNAKAHFGNKVDYAQSNYEACEGADALVINTEWNEYRQPDFIKIKELMNGKVIFDGRNLYKPDTLKDLGLKYFGVGIGN
ncbi:MAG: UDP-glucose/GDP-mannose dehydrogenase family protein [Candidatus Dadabacteria bacterium]|nr:UDP-glucose/GDP-mannose dehydrogenase family protein [Candidatus Dadabacteria bacterium]MCZ6864096.1 UDP-glucose/GDP-mannose dehydrogenase family protein [Candidatus Dadabacteria bacterium]